ncbi:MAG: MATE family efflux transporter [Alphaproteobacteria bacterium]|nr:MATE family efflux transporter [Alphaproteobacteria bacterium]
MAKLISKKDLPYKNKGDLTTGPIHKHLIRLTLPMIWGIFAVISVQLADTYFIGLLGTEELAAISFTFPVTMLLTHLIFGLNIAVSSVVSRLIGEKQKEDVKRVVQHAVILAFITSVVFAALTYIFLDPVFRALGADGQMLAIIHEYMPIWLLGYCLIAIPMNGNSAIRASGNAMHPAIVMTTVSIVNIVLDPIFIFGKFGLPAYGVQGAAIATVIAYICGMVLGLYFLIVREKLICLSSLHLDKVKDSLKRLGVIALPAGITNTIVPAGNAVILAMLAGFGAEVVAAYGVATRIEAFAMLTIIALATGLAPVVGQNWGAKIYERVHGAINMAIKFNLYWSFAAAIILGLFARQIAGAFSDDPIVIHYSVLFFWIVPFSYAFGNLVFGWSSAFNAMGMPERSFMMIVGKAALTLIGAYVGSLYFGVIGVFGALAGANVLSGALSHWISWRTCLKTEGQRQAAD